MKSSNFGINIALGKGFVNTNKAGTAKSGGHGHMKDVSKSPMRKAGKGPTVMPKGTDANMKSAKPKVKGGVAHPGATKTTFKGTATISAPNTNMTPQKAKG